MTSPVPATSVWRKVKMPRFAGVKSPRKCDVVIVGAGITGLTAAYLLKRSGRKVAVLERDRVAAVDTGQTTAHLTIVTDLRLKRMAKNFGKDAARLTWQAGATAMNTIEEVTKQLEIDCEFRRVPGYLHGSLDSDRDESQDFASEAELARELGFEAVFEKSVPYFGKPGIRFANQAKFHPLKYIAALARAVHGDGSMIFDHAEVSEFSDEPFAAVVNGQRIQGDYVVIATHVPLMGKTGLVSATLFQTKLAPYSSYVVGGTVPRGTVPEACYWDTSDPYYYLRINAGKQSDYLIFGGKDHKTGQADAESRFSELRAKLYSLIPQAKLDCQWSGQVIETNDGLPYIGETAESQFVATGFSGNGMTFGTLGGMMACDAVLKRENPWQKLFAVSRKKIRGGTWDFIKENLDYPYFLVRDRMQAPEGKSPRAVKRGEGAVIEIGGQRVACSRDERGNVSLVSAICTHMGCIVHWNGAESTWDCPCHGSRFRANGEVLAGPAESPLKQVQTSNEKPAAKTTSARKKKPASQGSGARKTSPRSGGRRSR